MKYLVLLVLGLVASSYAATNNQGWSKKITGWNDEALLMSIRAGVDKAFNSIESLAAMPALIREEMEETVVVRLAGRLTRKFRQLDEAIDGSFETAKEFVTSSMRTAAMRTRWPKEQLLQLLDEKVVQTEDKLTALYRSVGFLRSENESRMSAIDLEHITSEIVKSLVQDPGFISVIQWLSTLPESLHGIFDEFLANKTFKEIFDMLGNGQADVKDRVLAALFDGPESAADPQPGGQSAFETASALVHEGLTEATPILKLISQGYAQIVKKHVGELVHLIRAEHKNSPFVDADVVERIKAAAVKFISQ